LCYSWTSWSFSLTPEPTPSKASKMEPFDAAGGVSDTHLNCQLRGECQWRSLANCPPPTSRTRVFRSPSTETAVGARNIAAERTTLAPAGRLENGSRPVQPRVARHHRRPHPTGRD
jgi:hypothetical protein